MNVLKKILESKLPEGRYPKTKKIIIMPRYTLKRKNFNANCTDILLVCLCVRTCIVKANLCEVSSDIGKVF